MGRHRMDDAERMELYNAGLTDGEIAKREFVGKDAIRYWRKSRGLPANAKKNLGEAHDNR